MARHDWYRRNTWTTNDEVEFFARLERSRGPSNKVQYLRIQAMHLQEAGYYADALNLLNRAQEYPEEYTQATLIFIQRAECLWEIGDAAGSFEMYSRALDSQQRFPNVVCGVALSFAERYADYDSGAYRLLLLKAIAEELHRNSGLPADLKARYCLVMERLNRGLNHPEEAAKWARLAAETKESKLPKIPLSDSYGTIATTRAGNPDPPCALGKVTITMPPDSGS